MSLPNVIYRGYGAEKETSSTKIGSLPFGQMMILPDGRTFRHAQAGASLGAGVIVSTSAVVDGHGGYAGSGLLASVTSTYNQIGDTTIRLLSKAVAFTTDQYADGYLNVQGPAASAWAGHLYKIKSNKSAASASELEIELEKSDGLKVAFAAGSTTCSLRRSPFRDAIVAATAVSLMGVTPVAVSSSYYFWCQTKGPASVEQGGTAVSDGQLAANSSAEAGSATLSDDALIVTEQVIGKALETASASEAVLVDLWLDKG